MLIRDTPEYANFYREKWIKQNKLDQAMNPRLRAPHNSQINTAKYGKLGGAPKLELSKKAQTINKLMLKKMTVAEIADIVGTTHQSVSQIRNRYGLPRGV
jgi:DNA-directed RNA polymerase specialized sigma subunit